MALLVARNIEKHYGDRVVLRGCDLTIDPGDRVGLVGVNGSGKSTLLRILAGAEDASSGELFRSGSLALLEQDPRLPGATVEEAAREALSWHAVLLADWEEATLAGDEARAAALQTELDLKGWDLSHQVAAVLGRVKAPPPETPVATLSGGEARRVALARALLQAPDVLMLDEPTNHLDVDTVEWLEGVLSTWRGAVVFVTHDRYLLEAVATEIVEIDDGLAVSYEGSYTDYLLSRAERRAQLEQSEDRRLAFIAREAEWASRSPAARTTKQKGRLARLDALRAVRPIRKEETFSLDFRTGTKLSTLVEARGLRKRYGDRTLFSGLDLALQSGDRLGVLGPNGCGKSTLLGLLAGRVKADAGEIVAGPRVRVALLDQQRSGLNPDHTVFEAAGGGNDTVKVGESWVHVASFLGRFLFYRDFFDQRVDKLSGGERARLLMAKLLLQGANVLLLDEPTNDLDLMTLSILEEALLAFDGAAVIVTHDRAFVDRVCTRVLAFEGGNTPVAYASRLQAVAAARRRSLEESAAIGDGSRRESARRPEPPPTPARQKLSFKEQRQLESLPAEIEKMEAERLSLGVALGDPAIWKSRSGEAQKIQARLTALGEQIATAYASWEALEARR